MTKQKEKKPTLSTTINWQAPSESPIIMDTRPHKPDHKPLIRNNGAVVVLSCTCYPVDVEEV